MARARADPDCVVVAPRLERPDPSDEAGRSRRLLGKRHQDTPAAVGKRCEQMALQGGVQISTTVERA
eukprot:2707977-Lingulodinium_polyedra.AAC.1